MQLLKLPNALISTDIVHKENIPDVIKDIAAMNKKNEKHDIYDVMNLGHLEGMDYVTERLLLPINYRFYKVTR